MPTDLRNQNPSERIRSLRTKTLTAARFLSIEQAKIITRVYQENENIPVSVKRAKALAASLREISITIDPEELIVGNRTPGIRAGVVFPEAGISWVAGEIHNLPDRKQDPFKVNPEDLQYFSEKILPFWKGKSLEDNIKQTIGDDIRSFEKVVKINQKDHAQGHISPDIETWLTLGPSGLLRKVKEAKQRANGKNQEFYESTALVLEAACGFIRRYADLAFEMYSVEPDKELKKTLLTIHQNCLSIAGNPPSGFYEAVQSLWFLFVILQMESNASSFSPGRLDKYLYPFYISDLNIGKTTIEGSLEILDALFIKFNQIVYLRNEHSARYFAGFPTGFNITVGGKNVDGTDATNELSFLILKAQEHIRLPQPNLTARLHKASSDAFISFCSEIIGLGTGMPQVVNDESIIQALINAGLSIDDAFNYCLVGCVEISSQGNFLGWSDAAMFNLVKVLELTLNNGKCLLTGEETGLNTGSLPDYKNYLDLENAFSQQIDFFVDKMIHACEVVEKAHPDILPSPFLSCVIKDCIESGTDITAGGAKYNYSGTQAIQVANIADSLAVLKRLVYEDKTVSAEKMLTALQNDFKDDEILRQRCINRVPKYGNDVEWVDKTGAKWIRYFVSKIKEYKNFRGGEYQTGLYTVSAHVPMGENTGASPDGRHSRDPLADGGLSPMYGRDKNGPAAVLHSVARIPSELAPNGTLLNMKFLPELFKNQEDRNKFSSFLKTFICNPVHHVQFNVVTPGDLIKAKKDPESYRGLTIRVAGYTAFFTELSEKLQDEIINRTTQAAYE